MRSLKSQLPALNALLTFEAAARHLSFTRAAGELFVSQAAVSRQIRRLEDQLGVPLFHRRHRALLLTEPGRRLQQAVTMGLGHIASVTRQLGGPSRRGQINLATTVAFATYWFMPRLTGFRQQHPDVDVRVLASDRHEDHLAEQVDIALTCGRMERPGWEFLPLFSELVFPVCSPGYLRSHPVRDLAELAEHSLLHLDRRHWEDIGWKAVDWSVWLGQFGIAYEPGHPLLSFNNYPMLVQAALAGEGVALGWEHLSEGLLGEGRLVRPVAEQWDFQRRYYLAVRSEPAAWPELVALRDWLLPETQPSAH